MYFYHIYVWKFYHAGANKTLAAAYVKCIEHLFCFNQYSSVTAMFLQLGLPTFNTALHNHVFAITNRTKASTIFSKCSRLSNV